jgi:hypothetical protein
LLKTTNGTNYKRLKKYKRETKLQRLQLFFQFFFINAKILERGCQFSVIVNAKILERHLLFLHGRRAVKPVRIISLGQLGDVWLSGYPLDGSG